MELAVFANPRIPAHVDRGAPGFAEQRLGPFGPPVNELRAELGRGCNPRYWLREHATTAAGACFEQQHPQLLPAEASGSRQTRRAGADDDDIRLH